MQDRFYNCIPYDICLCDIGCHNIACTRNINTQFVKDYMSKYKGELFSVCKSWECSSFIGEGEDNMENDMINKPKHYIKTVDGIEYECKDTIAIVTSDEIGRRAFNLGNAIKYLWRYKSKNGTEDLRKAIKNIELLIESVEED